MAPVAERAPAVRRRAEIIWDVDEWEVKEERGRVIWMSVMRKRQGVVRAPLYATIPGHADHLDLRILTISRRSTCHILLLASFQRGP